MSCRSLAGVGLVSLPGAIDLYRKDYTSEAAFKRGLASYIEFYSTQRPHRTLKNLTPCQVEDAFMSDKS